MKCNFHLLHLKEILTFGDIEVENINIANTDTRFFLVK